MPNGDNKKNDPLESVNKQISDMEEAESKAEAEGLKPWEYNLSAKTKEVTNERLAEEERIRKAEEALANGQPLEKGTTMINGNIVQRNINIPQDTTYGTKEVVEKTYPGGGIYRTTQGALNLTKELNKPGRTTALSPFSIADLYNRQQNKVDEYGNEYTYDPQMALDFPELREYQTKVGSKKVIQVIDRNNMINGKPAMFLQPVITKEDVLNNAPKQSDFSGDLNYLRKHSEALKKYFEDAGIDDWEKLIKDTGEFRNIYDVQYGQ
jgi:hypothetical protein